MRAKCNVFSFQFSKFSHLSYKTKLFQASPSPTLGGSTYSQHFVEKTQQGQKDCGVYCAIYARNIMTGEKYEYDDYKETERKDTRRLICQSIYMNRDLRITD